MKRFWSLAVILALSLTLFVGCSTPAEPAVYKDGTYVGVSDATDRGATRAEIIIKNDKIESVKIVDLDGLGLEKTEEYAYEDYHTAIVELADAMQEENTWDVDVVAGATSTSNNAKQAAQRAMEKALVKPTSTAAYYDGTFMAISEQTERGWTIAWVTVEGDAIEKVVVHSTASTTDDKGNVSFARKDSSYPYEGYFEALELIPERMVAKNSTDIEAVTGATSTTDQAKEAAAQALTLAKR